MFNFNKCQDLRIVNRRKMKEKRDFILKFNNKL